jgi:hypothetical protein
VSGAAPPIATDNASLSGIVNRQQITELPLNGRDTFQLAVTTPSVFFGMISTMTAADPGEKFIDAGTREIDNQASLDGVTIINNLVGKVNYHPSVDAVQEVNVQRGTSSAQYRNYQGVHIKVVSKSGTNELYRE